MVQRQTTTVSRTELDYQTYEEQERKDMKLLIKTTAQLIGNEALPVGSLHKNMFAKTYLAMRTWAQRSARPNSKAPHVVEQLLQRLVQERDSGNEHALINTQLYNVVLDSWSKSGEDGAANRAEEILCSMETMYANGDTDVRPNRASFNSVIKAFVKAGDKHYAVSKAEAIIGRMTMLSQTDDGYLPPNRRGYNLLLYALANSDLVDAGERAEAILQHMSTTASVDKKARPDINSYNLVIKIWAKGDRIGFERRAQDLFEQIMALPPSSGVKPNFETFNFILGCWSKSNSPEALGKTMELLSLCEQAFNNGNSEAKPDCVTINTVIATLTRNPKEGSLERATELQKEMEQKYQIKLDTISNNILMDGWSKSGRPDATDVVNGMLTRMEVQFREGTKNLKPDRYSYTSAMDAFVRSKRTDAGEQCSEIMRRMKELHIDHGGDAPTVENYNSLVNAWANTRTKVGADMALKILTEMEETSTVPNPDRVTFNSVLKALRNGASEHAIRAEELLVHLEELGRNNTSLAPDAFSYSTVINTLGRCNIINDKAERVLRILQRMIISYEAGNLKAKPNLHCFNAALNACAFNGGDGTARINAFTIMVGILVLLAKYASADHMTYGTILRACSALLHKADPRRDELVERVFDKARREGQASHLVVTQLYFAASPSLYEQLMGQPITEKLTVKDLPLEWSARVFQRKGSPM